MRAALFYAPNGPAQSAALGYSAGPNAVATTVQASLRTDQGKLWDYLSDVKRASVLAGTQTDVTVELQTAMDNHLVVSFFGNLSHTATIYAKRNGACLIGYGYETSKIEFINASGGTAFSGHVGGGTNVIANCEFSNFAIGNSAAGTAPTISFDTTTFANSIFDLSIQNRRANATLYYGQGNSGSSPYYNIYRGELYGGADKTQKGIHFAPGTWAGGSNGPNANHIGPFKRCASLDYVFYEQSGNGNIVHDIVAESIRTAYISINENAAVESGTATSSGQVTLNDTAKAFPAYTNYAVEITGGTGVGQVRKIKSNTGTALTIDNAWSVRPDATSTYSIFKNSAVGTLISAIRGEGSAGCDFIRAFPGTYGNAVFNTVLDSLGAGLYVRDKSGCPNNKWFGGRAVIYNFSHIPGASANVSLIARSGLYGGQLMTNYVIEWASVNICNSAPTGTYILTLDAGGATVGTGQVSMQCIVNGSAGNNLGFVMPSPTQRISLDGTNRPLQVNAVTDATFNAAHAVNVTIVCTSDL